MATPPRSRGWRPLATQRADLAGFLASAPTPSRSRPPHPLPPRTRRPSSALSTVASTFSVSREALTRRQVTSPAQRSRPAGSRTVRSDTPSRRSWSPATLSTCSPEGSRSRASGRAPRATHCFRGRWCRESASPAGPERRAPRVLVRRLSRSPHRRAGLPARTPP